MKFILDFPVSVNNLYFNSARGRTKTEDARVWQEKALWMIKEQSLKNRYKSDSDSFLGGFTILWELNPTEESMILMVRSNY